MEKIEDAKRRRMIDGSKSWKRSKSSMIVKSRNSWIQKRVRMGTFYSAPKLYELKY